VRGYVDGGFTDEPDLEAAVRAARRAFDVGPWPRRRDRAALLRAAGFEVGPEPAGSARPGEYVLHVPVGVVATSEPRAAIPALAAGNAVILAAGELALAERLDAAELPSGAFNLVPELEAHPGIDLIRPVAGAPVTLDLDVLTDDEALATVAERISLRGTDVARAHRLAPALRAEHVWINVPAEDLPDPIERFTRRITVSS
jgi:acyl-CoA reductase-like NAD-dependent aldehyde dehydrogenase